jgi:MIP family channel proteins/HAD superfamily hydrolase (TIGR01549 family)
MAVEASSAGISGVEEQALEQEALEPSTTATIVGEIVGSFLLATLGLGAGAAAFVYGSHKGVSWFSDIWPTSFAWTLSIALAIYCTASLSGAHFNPAVTLALAATKRFSWSQVPRYIVCQLIGWFLGAALVVALFGHNIKQVANAMHITYGGPGSQLIGRVLTTYVPNPGVFGTGAAGLHSVPIWTGFLAEILGTAVLIVVIFSLLESRNANAPSAWFFPLIVGATVGLLIMILAGLTQASFNPARDLGPRLMLLIMGFRSHAFPGPRDGLALAVTVVGPLIGGVAGAFFFDKVMRPHIPGVTLVPAITSPGQMARGDSAHEHTMHGHAPLLPFALRRNGSRSNGYAANDIDLVMLDMGGTIYDDDNTAQANLEAIRKLAGKNFDEQEFWRIYDESRQEQTSMQRALAVAFLGGDVSAQRDLTERNLKFAPESLYPDVRATLEVLAEHYKLGVASNNNPVQEALHRDGLFDYFTVIATPATSGADKTDPAFWRWALEQAGVSPERAVHVGNRLDSDIRPVKQVGIRTVWMLRGEAPPAPTREQLAEPDAVVTNFLGLPTALAELANVRASDSPHETRS